MTAVELHDIDEGFGRLIGRCTGCGGPTFFGHCTVEIGWPKSTPAWETITPTVALDVRKSSKPPKRGSKLKMLEEVTELAEASPFRVHRTLAGGHQSP